MCQIIGHIVRIAVKRDTDNRYYAHTPGLKGLHVSRETKKEALNDIVNAIVDMIKVYNEQGMELPDNPDFKAIKNRPVKMKELIRNSSTEDRMFFPIPAYLAAKQLADCESRL